MVAVGRVRVEDRVVDFGRRRVSDLVLSLPLPSGTLASWICIARAVVNEDGCAGVALRSTVWSEVGLALRRRVRVSAWEYAWVPGPLVLLVFGGTVSSVGLV